MVKLYFRHIAQKIIKKEKIRGIKMHNLFEKFENREAA